MAANHSISGALSKTFRNPYAYIGAAIVGLFTFIITANPWGLLASFLASFIVFALMRHMSELEVAKERAKLNQQHQEIGDGRSQLPMIGLTQLNHILEICKGDKNDHLLIKININAAGEVMRLSTKKGLLAESDLTMILETRIQGYFSDALVFKTEYSAFLVIMKGTFGHLRQRVADFAEEYSHFKLSREGVIYYPKLIIGCTPLDSNNGDAFSRLEFAIDKATFIPGSAYWYISEKDPEYLEHKRKRIGLRQMRKAIGEHEIGLFCQPIVSLQGSTELPKYELLMRHFKSAREIAPPYQLLEAANYNQVTQDLDIYVVELLCKNFAELFGPGGERLEAISINISGPSFATPRFSQTLNDLVNKYNVPKSKLILEITEDVTTTQAGDAEATMNSFKKLGFKLALDDIGTGSSNFQNLKKFPVDYFKIDRAYCQELLSDKATFDFVTMIIDVAKDQGKMIIAEGIPDEETLQKLTEMGADYSQSFLTGRPAELVRAEKYTHS